MFFGIFVLSRVSILSIFVLNRVSFLRQEPITLFLDDKQPALMFYECLKLGIKNRNSVLNRVGKSAIFVVNRVRVWGAEPHLPTQGYIEYLPIPPGCSPVSPLKNLRYVPPSGGCLHWLVHEAIGKRRKGPVVKGKKKLMCLFNSAVGTINKTLSAR